MRIDVPESIVKLAKQLNFPIYLVGGFVRNSLIFGCDNEVFCKERLRNSKKGLISNNYEVGKNNNLSVSSYKSENTDCTEIDKNNLVNDVEFDYFYTEKFLLDFKNEPKKTVDKDLNGFETDYDICGSVSPQEILDMLDKQDYAINSINKTTGTIVIYDKKTKDKFEYTTFRKEVYSPGGGHTPIKVEFVNDLKSDAKRRDFTVNSIYCEVLSGEIIDPLSGVSDIENKIIRTSDLPEKTFSSDGLRIMRMARFACQLGFNIENQTIQLAEKFCSNLKDISAERIRDELVLILSADEKYPGLTKGTFPHYRGLKILEKVGFFNYYLTELYLGKNISQREDFHAYDVFEHSLQAVKFSHKSVRLAALLHDVGKPESHILDGNMFRHNIIGEELCGKILGQHGLRFPKSEIAFVKRLVNLHMVDIKCEMREVKVRLLIIENIDIIEQLFQLKQADYLGCGIKRDICPTVERWCAIYESMRQEKIPFTLKELDVCAMDIIEEYPEIEQKFLSSILKELHKNVIVKNLKNDKNQLLCNVKGVYKNLKILA